MQAIPVTKRLPEPNTPQDDAFVLAYETGEYPGWVAALYHPDSGWQYDTSAVSGYEWEVSDMNAVTHWMPYPPAPMDNEGAGRAPMTTEQFSRLLPELFAAWITQLDDGELPAIRGALVDLVADFQSGKAEIVYKEEPHRDEHPTTTT